MASAAAPAGAAGAQARGPTTSFELSKCVRAWAAVLTRWQGEPRSGEQQRGRNTACSRAACLRAAPPHPQRRPRPNRRRARRRLQNELRERDRKLDVAQKDATALKTQLAAKDRRARSAAAPAAARGAGSGPRGMAAGRHGCCCAASGGSGVRGSHEDERLCGARRSRARRRTLQQHTVEVARLKERVLKAEQCARPWAAAGAALRMRARR
jgi:hypothetical protein